MNRQDQWAIVSDAQHFGRDFDALGRNLLDFRFQSPGVEHDAIADNGGRASDNPGRKQRKLVGLVTDDQRMAGIVAALEPHDHVCAARKPIHDLALAFVAPLGADDGHVPHVASLFSAVRRLLEASGLCV